MDIDDARALDELDLAIVQALQIDARAPWTRIAAAVGADAATVARHWHALREESLAWLTAWPTPERWSSTTDVAIVLLDRRTSADVVAAVVRRPWVLSADDTSAGVLVLVAGTGGLPLLGDRVREIADAGARVRRMDVAAAIVAEDSGWRLRVLSRSQQRAVRDEHDGGAARIPRPEVVAEVADTLDDDPRMPAATLAQRLGVSEATARRTVDRAVGAGLLRLGCDLAMPAAGYRRGAVLWARSGDVEEAAARASRLPETHRVGVLVGSAPLFVCARARSLTALPRIERAWGDKVEVTDRWTVLREIKRNGHLLDAAGRSIERVPLRW
ncbi:Lrp/AsnC family transcriptional regulator [Microbacterium sp. ASV49]|uniref:Lrp/AsnC family transcriptional regulator n=1 Tax=Microbacterium candidum TaxID=3041922 RepID=A0ABT7MYJ5_9MICO|nr:Lrp/AsnC family transcriptional regulator [Microbacterium sp. ASV49]MDL9979521.1 Lrp/AsnC family transcriptional regulator [Microbacterium sp. ASV49]